jgi:hypothetical protein
VPLPSPRAWCHNLSDSWEVRPRVSVLPGHHESLPTTVNTVLLWDSCGQKGAPETQAGTCQGRSSPNAQLAFEAPRAAGMMFLRPHTALSEVSGGGGCCFPPWHSDCRKRKDSRGHEAQPTALGTVSSAPCLPWARVLCPPRQPADLPESLSAVAVISCKDPLLFVLMGKLPFSPPAPPGLLKNLSSEWSGERSLPTHKLKHSAHHKL